MKRWKTGLAIACAVGLFCSSCGGSPAQETSAVAGEAAPLFYYSQGGLYMVRGDAEPRLLTDDVEEPPYVDRNHNFPGAQALHLLSPDGKTLAFSPRYTNMEDQTALYVVGTSKGKLQTVCDDLATFLRNWDNTLSVRFGSDGILYYIEQNREAVRTDLYAYEKGKSRLVAENVVSFYVGEDGKTILYYSAIEGTGTPQGSTETFLQQWQSKYSINHVSLNRLNTKTGECETFSNHASLNGIAEYDAESFSYFTFMETDEEQHPVRREVGDIPEPLSCTSGGEVVKTISPGIRVVKDTGRGAWILEADGHEPYILESLYPADIRPGVPAETQLYFTQTGDVLYFYNDSILDKDASNLYRLTIEGGKVIEKKDLHMHADRIIEDYKGGVFFFQEIFDDNWMTALSYTDGTNTVSFESLPEETAPTIVGSSVYLFTSREEGRRQDIYRFDGTQAVLWAENVYGLEAANNRLYYTKEDAAPFSLYQGETLIAEKVDGIVNLYEEIV